MKTENKWWYPEDFWVDAFKILILGFLIELALIILISIPNLIFEYGWIKYISWLLPFNFLICQIAIFIILVKGLWRKIRDE